VVPSGPDVIEFGFRFTPAYLAASVPFGVGPHSSGVAVSATGFAARFGPWRVTTLLSNIVDTAETGPYHWHRTAGPARYSVADGGLTFASNGDRGLCLQFAEPVPGLEPTRTLRHPNLTLTVADVAGLRRVLDARAGSSAAVPLDVVHSTGESPEASSGCPEA